MKLADPSIRDTPADAGPGLTPEQARSLEQIPEILGLLRTIHGVLSGRMKEYYKVDETAELTGRAPYTVRAWIAQGRIAATRVSGSGPRGRLLVPRAELEKLVGQGLGGDVPAAAVKGT